VSVRCRYSMRSRLSGRWTLGGRRPETPKQLRPAFPALREGDLEGWWTFVDVETANRRPLLTMEVPRRYWRTRPGTRGHVSPANHTFAACLRCPRVPVLAQADVPVSYPRCVVCSQNTNATRRIEFKCRPRCSRAERTRRTRRAAWRQPSPWPRALATPVRRRTTRADPRIRLRSMRIECAHPTECGMGFSVVSCSATRAARLGRPQVLARLS
jgi:hypothetical protein